MYKRALSPVGRGLGEGQIKLVRNQIELRWMNKLFLNREGAKARSFRKSLRVFASSRFIYFLCPAPALIICLIFCLCAPVQAQNLPESGNPVEITADGSLEWFQEKKQFVARKNAKAVQGDFTLEADLLTADYIKTPDGETKITKLTADGPHGQVKISMVDATATGDTGVYDPDTSLAELYGEDLRLKGPDGEILTAEDKFTYDIAAGRLSAHGRPVLTRGRERLSADTLSAVFAEGEGADKNRDLEKVIAKGNVRIVTPTEEITGSSGTYDARTNTAELTGDVRLKRGPNVLNGNRAEVDLNKGLSKLFGAPESGGRVRGVFYPDSTSTKETGGNE